MCPAKLLPLILGPGVFLLLLAIGLIFGRRRYKYPFAAPPAGEDWAPTDERFRDPVSGEDVVVWYRRSTGERCYVRR